MTAFLPDRYALIHAEHEVFTLMNDAGFTPDLWMEAHEGKAKYARDEKE